MIHDTEKSRFPSLIISYRKMALGRDTKIASKAAILIIEDRLTCFTAMENYSLVELSQIYMISIERFWKTI